MKILIFIEHDVMIRHFIDSGVFNNLIAQNTVVFIFPEKGHKRVSRDISSLKLNTAFRHLRINPRRQKIWKRLFQVDLLRWKLGEGFKALRILHREMIGWKATIHYSFLGVPGIYNIFKYSSLSRISKEPHKDLDKLLIEEKPDLLIHPSVLEGVFINDLIKTSKENKLPLLVIMNSWDNPSTKRAMVGNPDWLLVWGDQTKKHAIEYTKISPDRVLNFGAAQFDVYKKPPRINRSTFCKIHHLRSETTIILYAGSSKGTDEYAHLTLIDDAIENGDFGDVSVVYRPHPWGNGGNGGERIFNNSWNNVCIDSTMLEYIEGVSKGNNLMSFPDYYDTHDILSSVDVLISPLSTILLEGALHGKPVLCFLPIEESDARHFQLTYSLKHFEDMFKMQEFLVAKDYSELLTKITILLDRSKDAEFKQKLDLSCNYFVESFEKSYGDRLVEFCNRFN